MALEVCVRLAAASASAAALVALVVSGKASVNYALVGLAAVSAVENLAALGGRLTPEVYAGFEVLLAWLAAVAALEIGHEAWRPIGLEERRVWGRILRAACLQMGAVAALGLAGAAIVPEGDRWGYRGLACATAGALAFVVCVREGLAGRRRLASPLGDAALAWLPLYLGAQVAYLLAWELSRGLALALAVPVAALQVGAMLSLAWAAFGGASGRAGRAVADAR